MPTVKKGLCAALLMLMAVFCCLPAPAEDTETLPPNMRVVNCRQDVSLREKPSTKAKRLKRVPLGAEVLAWLDGGSDDAEASRFLYCEYQGMEGYILAEYLAPIAERYDASLGFSVDYNPYRLRPAETETALRLDWIGLGGVPAYLELTTPGSFSEDPLAYMEAHTDYTDTYTAPSGVTVTGGTRASEDFSHSLGFYIITLGNRTVLAQTSCPIEWDEIADADFQAVLHSLSFGE